MFKHENKFNKPEKRIILSNFDLKSKAISNQRGQSQC